MQLVMCAGGCGKMVRESEAICMRPSCIERVFYTPPRRAERSLYKAFAHHKAALVAAVSLSKGE